MKTNTTYDVQILRSDRWSTESRQNDEEAARAVALKLLAAPNCEGARVLRCWLRGDGSEMETEIFSKTQQVKEDGVARIDHIDSAPDRCEAFEDYFSLSSRLLMGRLLHSYLDKVTLTPTEILHSPRDFKRLQDKDSLFPTAVDRVATLQMRQDGGDVKARKEEIFKAVEAIVAKGRNCETVDLPKASTSLAALIAALPATANEWERDYLVRTALTRDLKDIRSFSGKLEKLCKLAQGVDDPSQAVLMDGFIAELLETSATQDILGWQAGLGQAICSMIDLTDGIMATKKSEAVEVATLLNTLFAQQRLPNSRAGMIERAHRQIGSVSPLYRSDELQEYDTFKKVVLRVLSPSGLLSGTVTAVALTGRYLRMVKDSERKDAISAVFRAMPDRAYGIIYLCDLAGSEFGADATSKLVEAYPPTIAGQHITNIVQRNLSPKDRLIRATAAYHALVAAPFQEKVKQPVIDHIDRLLDEYVVEERIVEKLDNPDATLRDRAVRLVQFCASGVLPEGRALARARQRIKEVLRHPNFDAHFVEGITDPAKAQKALRDFHQLLINKAGFSG
jgi:hypothetical protein